MRLKKRIRCPFCKKLFRPDPRTAWRQWACSDPSCQVKRRQDTQRQYRQRNPGDLEARRYRAAVAAAKSGDLDVVHVPKEASLGASLVWDEIKDELMPQHYVTIAFIVKLVMSALRDETSRQLHEMKDVFGNLAIVPKKDETAFSPAPP